MANQTSNGIKLIKDKIKFIPVKKYEEVYRGKVNEVLNEIEDIKGEIVVIVEGCEAINYNEISIVEHVNSYIKEGFSVIDSIKKVAHDRKINKNEVYKEYHS